MKIRTYRYCFWSDWIPWTLYRQQTWCGAWKTTLLVRADSLIVARQGCTVIVPFREEMAKRHLKVAGDLGRVIFMVCQRVGASKLHAYSALLGI